MRRPLRPLRGLLLRPRHPLLRRGNLTSSVYQYNYVSPYRCRARARRVPRPGAARPGAAPALTATAGVTRTATAAATAAATSPRSAAPRSAPPRPRRHRARGEAPRLRAGAVVRVVQGGRLLVPHGRAGPRHGRVLQLPLPLRGPAAPHLRRGGGRSGLVRHAARCRR